MTIGDRVKARRTELGMRQMDLAEKAGMSKQLLCKYESNTITNIPSDRIARLSEALNCSPSYLMGWDEPNWKRQHLIDMVDHMTDQQVDAVLALIRSML